MAKPNFKALWRRGLLLVCLSAAAGAGACRSGRGEPLSVERRMALFTPDLDGYSRLGYNLRWKGFPPMAAGGRVARVEVLGDVVGVQDTTGFVSVLETGSGGTRWSGELANPLTKFVGMARDGQRIVVASETEAYFLDVDTGTLVDKARLDRVANTRPIVYGPMIIFATSGGEIFAQLSRGGFRAWGNRVGDAVEVDPVLIGDVVAVVSRDGGVAFLDAGSGSGMGRNRIFRGPGAAMGASGDTLFVASLDQSLYAFGVVGGAQLWRVRTDSPLRNPPVHHDGSVYCAIPGRGLVAFNSGSGVERWTAAGVMGDVIGVRRGRLVVWTGSELVLIDPADGAVRDRTNAGGASAVMADQFEEGNLYVVHPAGVVAKFSPGL